MSEIEPTLLSETSRQCTVGRYLPIVFHTCIGTGTFIQGCGSGWNPYSLGCRIRIRILNTDPNPGVHFFKIPPILLETFSPRRSR